MVLYENELFTRLTAAGKPEHADLSMEKSVGHIRKIVGKVERPGMDKKMEHVCEKIPTLPTHEHVGQDFRSGSIKIKKSQARRDE